MNDRILLVDDDIRLTELLKRNLEQQGYHCETVSEGGSVLDLIGRKAFDLVVLDIMMPDADGLELCRGLNASFPDLGVILLTGKGDVVNRVIGLEVGADDYLSKPCNPRELGARIKAVLRRRQSPASPGITRRFGENRFDVAGRRLFNSRGEHHLTTVEHRLLEILCTHPNQPLSRDRIMQLLYGREHMPFDRAIDVQISKLRRMVESDPARPVHIQTVWGMGYRFVPCPE